MAEITQPFDGGPYMTESGWSLLWGFSMNSGVMTAGTISPVANLAVYSDVDGRQVKVSPGQAHIRGHLYQLTDVKVLPVAPNSNPNGWARLDRVVLRLDTTGKSATPTVLTGTAAASPSVPSMIQIAGGIWDIPLAIVLVGPNFTTIAANDVSRNRKYAGTTGWYDFNPGDPFVVSGSPMGISSWTLTTARTCFTDMTCHFYLTGQIAFTGSNPGTVVIGLPFPAATYGIPLNADISNDMKRAQTSFLSGSTYPLAELNPYGSQAWPTDGVARGFKLSGSYEVAAL